MSTATLHNHESSFLRAATHSLHNGNGEYKYDGRKRYLQSIYALSPLHWKETQRLLAEYRDDPENKSLRDKIITGNLYLVARTVLSIAKRDSWSDFEDLLSEGYLGLSQAVEKFDKLGTSEFGAYAGFWIMQYVKRYIANNLSAVRVPIQAQEKLNIRGDADHGQDGSGTGAAIKLAHALVKQIDPYQAWVVTAKDCRSLYKVIVDEYGCEDPAYTNAFTRHFDVKLYWGDLDEREKLILLARNGLYEDRQWTLEELSIRVDRTRERVRQLEKIGCDKLCKRLLEEGYKSSEDYTGGCAEAVESPMEFFIPIRHYMVDDTNLHEHASRHAHSAYRRPFAARPVATRSLVCKRCIGYYFFHLGIIIPIDAEDVFLMGMGKDNLPMGSPHVVRIIVDNLMFVAKAITPWSESQAKLNMNIKWGKHNPIVKFLRSRHPNCYKSLIADRNWTSDESVFALYTTDEPGTFVLDDTPVESVVATNAEKPPVPDGTASPVLEANTSLPTADNDEEPLMTESRFSFDDPPEEVYYSSPGSLTLPDGTFTVKYWSEVLDHCFSYAFRRNPGKVEELVDIEAPFRRAVLFSRNPESLRRPKKLGEGLYMETNISAHGIVKSVCGLMAYCGFPVKEFSITYRAGAAKEKRVPSGSITDDAPAQERPKIDVSRYTAALLTEFPDGFEFNDSSLRLLENAVDAACSEAEKRELKRVMFRRYDGIYLLPEMVADKETTEALKARIQEYFDQYLAVSLPVLYEEFSGRLHALTNPDSDFRLFLLATVLPELTDGGKIFGKLQRQIAIPGSLAESEVLEFLAERIRATLAQCGDAILKEDLLVELPCLNAEALEMIVQDQLPEAVEIQNDGLQYWKLLESFCLPEDFAECLGQIIDGIEAQNKTPSLQAIAMGLEAQYGDGFREIYAIDDDEVFRQVVLKAVRSRNYSWKSNLLIKRTEQRETNVADEFLQNQHGIFHEQEFFEYAAQHRGLVNTGMLVVTFLRCKCIRLDQYHWLGLADFEQLADFNNETIQMLTRELLLRLQHTSFLPLGTLPNALFSELPPLHILGQTFYWNSYMLASIAEHKLAALRVVNTEPSPYTVTAMVIPANSDYGGDVIDFVFRALRGAGRQFANADQVFEYLKVNQIRMFKSQKLVARINAFWGFE